MAPGLSCGHTATNITSSTGWTLQGTSTVVSAGTGLPTNCVFTDAMGNPAPFALMPGLYGIAICSPSHQQVYTNGTGTNQVYSNGELTITAAQSKRLLDLLRDGGLDPQQIDDYRESLRIAKWMDLTVERWERLYSKMETKLEREYAEGEAAADAVDQMEGK